MVNPWEHQPFGGTSTTDNTCLSQSSSQSCFAMCHFQLRVPEHSVLRIGLLEALALDCGLLHQWRQCRGAGIHGLDIHEATHVLGGMTKLAS